jgi:hypothetical protein
VTATSFAWQNQFAVQHRPISFWVKISIPRRATILAIAYDSLGFSQTIFAIYKVPFSIF